VKGAAANLYAKELSALAAEIEAKAKAGTAGAEIQELISRLGVEIARATMALHNFAAATGQRASA
jgi:HPt (histidine-containing phosphotransfer) domain-containing protein